MSYADAHALQLEYRSAVETGASEPMVLLLEHQPLITLGRNASLAHLRKSPDVLRDMGIEVIEADRGGDVTYHGPGQLVAYPILDLHQWRLSIRWYLRRLEETLIDQLAGYGLAGERMEGLTGVWVDGAKVAAIGIGLRRWITFHGIALNVAPSMEHFDLIVPCGIADRPVTSLERLLPTPPAMAAAMTDFEQAFRRQFEASSHGTDS